MEYLCFAVLIFDCNLCDLFDYTIYTYPQLFLKRYAFREGCYDLIIEVLVTPEVKRLELFKLPQLLENGTDALYIDDFIIFKLDLYEIFAILDIFENVLCLLLINNAVFGDVGQSSCG